MMRSVTPTGPSFSMRNRLRFQQSSGLWPFLAWLFTVYCSTVSIAMSSSPITERLTSCVLFIFIEMEEGYTYFQLELYYLYMSMNSFPCCSSASLSRSSALGSGSID